MALEIVLNRIVCMEDKEKEIVLLKRLIDNRENTITWLNSLIDGQSKRIDELESELNHVKEINKNLKKENYELFKETTDSLFQYNYELKYKSKVKEVEELKKENELLKSKLNVLFNAFDSVKETKKETVQDTDSIWKQRHDEELKSPMWKKKREEVFERYGKQCVECGNTNNLQVHHLVYRKNRHLWEYNVDEMIPLCKKCHEKVHKDKNHKFHEKYIN